MKPIESNEELQFRVNAVLDELEQKKKKPLKTLIEIEKQLRRLRPLTLPVVNDEFGLDKYVLHSVERDLDGIRTVLTIFEASDNELHLPPDLDKSITYKDNESLRKQIDKYHEWCVDSIRILKNSEPSKKDNKEIPVSVPKDNSKFWLDYLNKKIKDSKYNLEVINTMGKMFYDDNKSWREVAEHLTKNSKNNFIYNEGELKTFACRMDLKINRKLE